MSKLEATITHIQSQEALHIVAFDFHGLTLKMMSLELPKGAIVGTKVLLGAKPTAIALAKGEAGMVSYSNQIAMSIKTLKVGELLCAVTLEALGVTLESIITKESAQRMALQEGEEVTALIKASELSIVEVLDV